MTHSTVTRATFTLATSLVALSVAFGCLANRPPAQPGAQPAEAAGVPHPGQQLFESYCMGCHAIDEALAFVRNIESADTARRELTALLASHGDSSADQDVLIVEYVISRR
ncbi:MAG TPA: hypothetical protein VLA20_01145 [Vicinamibacterales bacterium]|nr:hypothetical protein [Vicinamibacterales bacterium]